MRRIIGIVQSENRTGCPEREPLLSCRKIISLNAFLRDPGSGSPDPDARRSRAAKLGRFFREYFSSKDSKKNSAALGFGA